MKAKSKAKSKNRIIIHDRIYVPVKKTDRDRVVKYYEPRLYDQDRCQRCWNLENRHNEDCDACQYYKGQKKIWALVERKDKRLYFAVPSGNPKRVEKALKIDLSQAQDLRKVIPFTSKLRWKGNLYKGQIIKGEQKPDQEKLYGGWKKRYKITGGLIETPPRTGKTVIGVYTTCDIKVKTLITASQIEFLTQFCKRFGENTNLTEIAPRGRRSPVLLIAPNGWEHGPRYGVEVAKSFKRAKRPLEEYDVVLSTYQQFINEKTGSIKIKKYIRNKFSLIIIDEVDQANAASFSVFLNRTPFRYKLGLTATVKRKDGMEFVVRDIIGPVVSRGVTTAMVPNIELLETNALPGKTYKQWFHIERALADNVARNKLIVRAIFKDLRSDDRTSILIPCRHIKHIQLLTKMINKQARINNIKRGEKWQSDLAVEYRDGSNRERVIKNIENRNHRVVVAMGRMMQRGIDIKQWSHVYTGIIPLANPPVFYQLSNRVCTPYSNKPTPTVRMIVDAMPVSIMCFRKLFFSEIIRRLKPRGKTPARYHMNSKSYKRAMEIAQFPKSYSFQDSSKEAQELKNRRRF